jgi:YesN/AraC family two-component response regulator
VKKWSSVFANLAVSYISIVLVIVLLLCSAFYVYFSGTYKEELRNKNQLVLANAAQTIETSVLQRVKQIYLDLSLNKTADVRAFADASFASSPSKALELQEVLKSKVTGNSDIIHAVHLYSPGQNRMISSLYGLVFNVDQGNSYPYFADWVGGMRSSKQNSLWTPVRLVPQDIFSSLPGRKGEALLTYAHGYPYHASGANSELIIAIDVKESAINAILADKLSSSYRGTFVLDAFGNPINNHGQEASAMSAAYSASIFKTILAKEKAGSFNDSINGVQQFVSYQALNSVDWKLYSSIPSHVFYQKSIFVQKLVLGIGFAAIAIGSLLSAIFARATYRPIKRLAGKITGLAGHMTDPSGNEFRLIDSAFSRLNDKVSSLEETLQANSSAIRHNVVLNLLNNSYTREKLTEELQFLSIDREYPSYCCMIVHSGEALAKLDSRNLQYMMYRIINHLEALSLPDARIIAQELPDKKIAVLLFAERNEDEQLEHLSSYVLATGQQHVQMQLQLSWGSPVSDIMDVHQSYKEAVTLMKYGYFLPELSILKDIGLLSRENSTEEIPQPLLIRFREKLHARQLHETLSAVEQLVSHMREGNYSADYCHYIMANTVFVFSECLKSVRYQPPAGGASDYYHQYEKKHDIFAFRDWLVEAITTYMEQMEKRNNDRSTSSVEAAKQYILGNLSQDLSLDAVAAKAFISPKYLSKLFKEEAGVTYTEYVTSRRMERAKELIESNTMTIEQVAGEVGYATVAYFIKKFKEAYGCTPGSYLRQSALEA